MVAKDDANIAHPPHQQAAFKLFSVIGDFPISVRGFHPLRLLRERFASAGSERFVVQPTPGGRAQPAGDFRHSSFINASRLTRLVVFIQPMQIVTNGTLDCRGPESAPAIRAWDTFSVTHGFTLGV